MSKTPTILWFRRDLRLTDNPALHAALSRGARVLPLYIWDEAGEAPWAAGAASRWWLHHSLTALAGELRERGSRLFFARGASEEIIRKLVKETGAGAVYWNRCYEPALIRRDTTLKRDLRALGCEVESFNAGLLYEPQEIKNKSGAPFQVFTPFWRHCLQVRDPVPPGPDLAQSMPAAPVLKAKSLALEDFGLLPRLPWARGFGEACQPGEAGARKRLEQFLRTARDAYDTARDLPAMDGTSMLSPALHFGELGPRQIVAALKARSSVTGIFPASAGDKRFLDEIGWREFAHHLLFHFPDTPEMPLRREFSRFPWVEDQGDELLKAWQQGRTGYPIVDAGMRQLWTTGWMHNRVRMIVASFLVKHLRLDWRKGASWFWDTLVDADLAANTLGWQWSAGCGADAAPYFRIFNPVLQGQKFDADGDYVRRWVPELARLPAKWIHQPWAAPPELLSRAQVRLGTVYPEPVVDHAAAREGALAAFKSLRS